MTSARLETPASARTFVFAGKATVTLVSLKTGTRFTYKVKRSKTNENLFFVSVLIGPDNEMDYHYLGTVFENGQFRVTAKSVISPESPSARAFAWFVQLLRMPLDPFPETLEVWHEGKCGACGRKLTVPESIASGLGPECRNRFSAEAC
jgi:hypothetical protein